MTGLFISRIYLLAIIAGENAHGTELPSIGTIDDAREILLWTNRQVQERLLTTIMLVSVSYDQVLEKDGYKWIGYLSYSGSEDMCSMQVKLNTKMDGKKEGGVGITERMVS